MKGVILISVIVRFLSGMKGVILINVIVRIRIIITYMWRASVKERKYERGRSGNPARG
jgi:hypothetical protein